jgi:acyl-homoserine-lactone acylase
VALAVAFVALTASADAKYRVTVKRSAHGIPHIVARDFPSLAYGYAHALAEDNICVLADTYTTVRGERSKYFGPNGTYQFRGNSTTPHNLASDFFYRKIIQQGTIEKLLQQPPPLGPVPVIKRAVKGYVAGYNDWLAHHQVTDPACKGKPWVHPIELIDAYRRFYQLALLASAGVAIDGIGDAAPTPDLAPSALPADLGRLNDALGGIGSNAIALGSAGTQHHDGMLLGNPHFPWDGSERFYQAHLTIPGRVDVQGGSLFGVPLVLIGNTRHMAWSHTVSTARRFTPYQLTLVPGNAHSYLVDGQVEAMKPTEVSVELPDGSKETRTLYDTRWGPMLTSILGLPIFPWTPVTAFALGDVNAANFRYLNHFFFTNMAQSVKRLDAIERKYEGIPWVNTIAADSKGTAYYADIGAIPNVSSAKIADCSVALGRASDAALRVQILDGSRTACEWDDDPDAVAPGIFGPSHLPSLFRDDYVTNSNDSYWLSNPAHPLEGFSRVIGDERTARALRTRLGLRIVQQRLDGSDGLRGKGFTLKQLRDAVFNDRQYAGELFKDGIAELCASSSSPACPVLAKWDLHDNLDSRGALLFRRFASHVLVNPASSALPPEPSPFSVPFDADDPVNTPRGLNTSSPTVQQALDQAVSDLQGAGIPLDAPLGDFQYEKRGDEKIPIHGGPGTLGVFNAINVSWNASQGYPNVPHGSSYVQTVELPKRGCARVRTILTYSQSTSSASPFFADQTRMFSRKRWVKPPFCPAQMRRAHFISVKRYGGGYKPSRKRRTAPK